MDKATPSTSQTPGSATSWQPLRILTFYRVILAGLLAVLYFALQDSNPFNAENHQLFRAALLSYLVFSIAVGFTTRLHWPGYQFQALLQVLTDVAAIALLMHATGGATSALAVLLVIAVTAGALILPGRPAYLFAAVATLTLLFETGLASLSPETAGAGDITRAGLLGLVLFAAAGLAHVLAIRIRESEALAQQRGIDLANLQQLNQYIIQQLHSGVLVVDAMREYFEADFAFQNNGGVRADISAGDVTARDVFSILPLIAFPAGHGEPELAAAVARGLWGTVECLHALREMVTLVLRRAEQRLIGGVFGNGLRKFRRQL